MHSIPVTTTLQPSQIGASCMTTSTKLKTSHDAASTTYKNVQSTNKMTLQPSSIRDKMFPSLGTESAGTAIGRLACMAHALWTGHTPAHLFWVRKTASGLANVHGSGFHVLICKRCSAIACICHNGQHRCSMEFCWSLWWAAWLQPVQTG